MIVEHAASQADAEALVFEATRLSYGELNQRVNRLASGLGSLGLRTGDHVALLLGNCHQYLEAYYALSKAGMVAVPLNWRLSEQELAYIVNHSEATALIADQAHAEAARLLRGRIDRLDRLIGVETDGPGDMTPYEELVTEGSPAEPSREGLDESRMLREMENATTLATMSGRRSEEILETAGGSLLQEIDSYVDQTVHRTRHCHILFNLLNRGQLIGGFLVEERPVEFFLPYRIFGERVTAEIFPLSLNVEKLGSEFLNALCDT